MKPMAKTLTGAAVLTFALAGCASKATGTGPDSAAGNGNSTVAQSAPTSGAPGQAGTAGSSSSSAPSGSQTSGGSAPTAPPSSSGAPNGKPSAHGTDQSKYTSPDGVSVSSDGRTLSTPVQWGGCTEQPQLLVTAQDATQVVVEVKTVTHFRMGAMCPNIARVGESSATLAAPLANRQVIDAVTHSVIPTH